MVAPGNVEVEVINATLAKVQWDSVTLTSVRGHLQGYRVGIYFCFILIVLCCKYVGTQYSVFMKIFAAMPAIILALK